MCLSWKDPSTERKTRWVSLVIELFNVGVSVEEAANSQYTVWISVVYRFHPFRKEFLTCRRWRRTDHGLNSHSTQGALEDTSSPARNPKRLPNMLTLKSRRSVEWDSEVPSLENSHFLSETEDIRLQSHSCPVFELVRMIFSRQMVFSYSCRWWPVGELTPIETTASFVGNRTRNTLISAYFTEFFCPLSMRERVVAAFKVTQSDRKDITTWCWPLSYCHCIILRVCTKVIINT